MKSAFSLVELSIVLVILGLITGGILAGQNLIRAAELRSVLTEFEHYRTATMTFVDQYQSLPGDMPDATNIWSSAGGSGDIGDGCEAVESTGTETCDGDGNGRVGTETDSNLQNHESARFWQHLANAGLIEGTYNGVMEAASLKTVTIGVNAPESKMDNASFTIRDMGVIDASHTSWFAGNYGNTIHFGDPDQSMTTGAILTPKEAWSIDSKIDDGRPGLGRLVTRESHTDCHTTIVSTTAEYDLSNTDVECNLNFRNF